jgi:hypothetical protein
LIWPTPLNPGAGSRDDPANCCTIAGPKAGLILQTL